MQAANWTNEQTKHSRETMNDYEKMLDSQHDTIYEAILADDHNGEAPCSRWGTYARFWAHAAADLAILLADNYGDDPREHVELACQLVVNDHDDVAWMISNYGTKAMHERYSDELGEKDNR